MLSVSPQPAEGHMKFGKKCLLPAWSEVAGFLSGQLQREEGQTCPLYRSQCLQMRLLEPLRLEMTCLMGNEVH